MKKIINVETGEVTERELNAQELAQQVIDEEALAIEKAEAAVKAEAKAKAEGKLAALGLTTDDLRALGL
jgi:hypothetical protein